ncbi:MAG: hypothetical protein VZR00_08380 [Lachnospiraceae bacterium]|jgi:uncharacterized membrane protein YqjE|nr:hypothetical protein [Lachnospiraceae bacterium]
MKLDYLPKLITLTAGLVVCIITIVNKTDVTRALAMLLITLIVFYIIGNITKKCISKVIMSDSFRKTPAKQKNDRDKDKEKDKDKETDKDKDNIKDSSNA